MVGTAVDSRVIGPLTNSLKTDDDLDNRYNAINVLSNLNDPAALPGLVYARDHDTGVTSQHSVIADYARLVAERLEDNA
jgi:HEAT repeat protein